MTDVTDEARTARTDHPVLDVLANRWSPRAFRDDRPLDPQALSSALEAARWSPSAYNRQPWRFAVGEAGTPAFETILGTLGEFNQVWARSAGALVVAIAETADESGAENPTAVYDLGQAVAHLSVQAHADGLHVHQMSGFSPDAAAAAFGLREGLTPVTVLAIGELGDPAALPDALRERERAPRERKPLDELVVAGR